MSSVTEPTRATRPCGTLRSPEPAEQYAGAFGDGADVGHRTGEHDEVRVGDVAGQLEARAFEELGERRREGAVADDGGAAQRRHAAEPLPLEHHARPDAVGDGRGELARRRFHAREGERARRCGRAPCAGGCASPCARPRCRSARRGRSARRPRAPGARRRGAARPSEPGRMRVPSGKIRTLSPRSRMARAVLSISLSPAPRSTGKAPSALSSQPCQLALEQLALGHVVERPARDRRDDERVQERAVVGGDDVRAVGGMCSRPIRERRKYRWKNGCRTARTSQ